MSVDRSQIDEAKLETTFEGEDVVAHSSYTFDRAVKRQKVATKSTWRQIKKIGVGTFGEVWLQKEERGILRAVKSVYRHLLEAQKIDFSREIQALVELREHPKHFVQFLGWYDNRHFIYLAMEYIELGDLSKYLKDYGVEAKHNAAEIAVQVLEGLEILHDKLICHRDLKPPNILVASVSPISVKIADFGVSKRERGTTLKTRYGTLGYQSPELLGLFHTGRQSYTQAVDIWAFGCVFHECLTLETPFMVWCTGTAWTSECNPQKSYSDTDFALPRGYCEGGKKFPDEVLKKSDVTEQGIELVKKLLAADPRSRLSPKKALTELRVLMETGGIIADTKRLNDKLLLFGGIIADTKHLNDKLLLFGVKHPDTGALNKLLYRYPGQEATLFEALTLIASGNRATEVQYQFLIQTLFYSSDINLRVRSWTILQHATSSGFLAIVRLLLDLGADVNAEPASKAGRTALQAAAGGGHLDIVKVLLDSRANINAKPANIGGRTALQAAAGGGHLDIVKLLLDTGANISAKPAESDGRTALQAAAEGGHLDVVMLLLYRGADINTAVAVCSGLTALQAAARGGHLDIVKVLLDRGADINAAAAGYEGLTALQAAAGNGHLDVVKMLLDCGADIHAEPALGGLTALQHAIFENHTNVENLLRSHIWGRTGGRKDF